MRSRRHGALPGWMALVAALVVASTACGSNLPHGVQQAVQSASPGVGGSGLSSPLPAGGKVTKAGKIVNKHGKVIGTVGGGITGSGTTGGGTTGGGTTGGGTTGGTTGGGTTGGGTTGVGANGPGVTASTLAIGVITDKNADKCNAALGAAGASSVDPKQTTQALLDEINKQGGILGRKVVAHYHPIDCTSQQTVEQQGQEVCADWTKDHPVFATGSDFGPDFESCMEKAGSVIEGGGAFSSDDRRVYKQHPYVIDPVSLDANTQAIVTVDGLYKEHYFTSGYKLGLVTVDCPSYHYAVDKSFMPELGKYNLKLTDSAYLTCSHTLQDDSTMARDAASAVLKFEGEGIDHVIVLDNGGGLPTFLFMNAAERQDYHPRYGLNSQSGNTVLAEQFDPSTAQDQFKNALSVGWIPKADVSTADQPKNAGAERCLALMRRHNVQMSSSNAEGQALQDCETLWFLQAQLQVSGSQIINQPTLLQGVARIGFRYHSVLTFASHVTATRHDGAGKVADLKFDGSCTCFHYITNPYPVPG